jgi:hypothetical protein
MNGKAKETAESAEDAEVSQRKTEGDLLWRDVDPEHGFHEGKML